MNRSWRILLPLLAIVLVFVIGSALLRSRSSNGVAHTYQGASNSFVSQLDSGQVSAVLVNTTAQTVQVTPKSGAAYTVGYPDSTQLSQLLAKYPAVAVTAKSGGSSWWSSLLIYVVMFGLLIGFWIFMMRRMQGGMGGSKVMSFGKSRALMV